jgi:hypothetical protein
MRLLLGSMRDFLFRLATVQQLPVDSRVVIATPECTHTHAPTQHGTQQTEHALYAVTNWSPTRYLNSYSACRPACEQASMLQPMK